MKRLRKTIFACMACGWFDTWGRDGDTPDKCPYCAGDDWKEYRRVEYRDWHEDDEEEGDDD